MKKQFLPILILLLFFTSTAQQSFVWGSKVGVTGGGGRQVYNITKTKADKEGNMYITGLYDGSIAFPNGVIISNNPGYTFNTVFLAKYNANGQVLWGINPVGNLDPASTDGDFDIDTDGNVYFAWNATILKLDTNGNQLWSKTVTGPNEWSMGGDKVLFDERTSQLSLVFSSSNSASGGTVDFTNGVTATIPFQSNQLFSVKYSAAGTAIVANYILNAPGPIGVAGDANGNIYIEGMSNDYADTLKIFKFNALDTLIGSQTYLNSIGGLIAADIFCNRDTLYLTGKFYNGILQLGTRVATSNAQIDFFVAKMDTGLRQAGLFSGNGSPSSQSYAYNSRVDNAGYLYVSGYCYGGPGGNPGAIGTPNFSLANGDDCFVIKYRADGTTVWLKSFGINFNNNSGLDNIVMALSGDNNSIYVAGTYQSWATFDNDTISDGLASYDGFVAKLGQCSLSIPDTHPNGDVSMCQGSTDTISVTGSNVNYLWSNNATTSSITVDSSGIYTVTISDQTGCSITSLPVTVIVHSNPATPTISQSGNVLASSASAGDQWYLSGSPITGATAQIYSATDTGSYTVVITDTNECQASSMPVIFTEVGIQSISNYTFALYPNPTTGLVRVTLPEGSSGKLSLTDITGKQLLVIPIEGALQIIDFTGFGQGVYILSYQYGDTKMTVKVVKE